jgi:hypothetical protein
MHFGFNPFAHDWESVQHYGKHETLIINVTPGATISEKDSAIKKLLEACLQKEGTNRPTAKEVQEELATISKM